MKEFLASIWNMKFRYDNVVFIQYFSELILNLDEFKVCLVCGWFECEKDGFVFYRKILGGFFLFLEMRRWFIFELEYI